MGDPGALAAAPAATGLRSSRQESAGAPALLLGSGDSTVPDGGGGVTIGGGGVTGGGTVPLAAGSPSGVVRLLLPVMGDPGALEAAPAAASALVGVAGALSIITAFRRGPPK